MKKITKIDVYCLYLLGLFQVFDGILTYFGTLKYGIKAEGNPIIEYLMFQFGPITALLFVKLLSLYLIVKVLRIFEVVNNISLISKLAIYLVIFIYIFGSIIPWTYLLFFV